MSRRDKRMIIYIIQTVMLSHSLSRVGQTLGEGQSLQGQGEDAQDSPPFSRRSIVDLGMPVRSAI